MKETITERALKIACEEIGESCGDVGLKATLKILKAIERALIEANAEGFDEGFDEGRRLYRNAIERVL